MAKGKSRAELQAENRLLRSYHIGIAIAQVLATAIRFGGAVSIAFFCYKTVAVLAGKATFSQIGISLLTDVKVSEAVAWIFGGGGVFYGMRQGRLRKDTIERLSSRIQELERLIDPKRTSSRLTPRGDEPPEAPL